MKHLLIYIVFTFSICNTSAQGKFPESWIGNYEGEMKIGYYDKPGMLTQVKYSLQEIIKDSVWSHKMIFNSEQYGKVIKDYVIRASKRGDHVNFILDELNGVEMEMSFMNDCFYSFFMLNESSYTTTFRRLSDGSLLWDLYVTPHGTKKVDVIASGEGEQKRTFEVSSFKPSLHQTVIFRKKN